MLQRRQQCPDGQQANPADLSLAHNFYFSLSFARPGRQSNLISPAVMPPRAQIRRRMFYCESVIDSQSVRLHKQMISDDIAGFLYTLLECFETEPCKILPSWGQVKVKVNTVLAPIYDNVWQLSSGEEDCSTNDCLTIRPSPRPSHPGPTRWREIIRETMCSHNCLH